MNKLIIFTDGACSANGQKGARAGYGVVLWNFPRPDEPFDIKVRLPAIEPQTNQRAELRALNRAFEEIRDHQITSPVTVWTDSEYARKCVTEWGPQWRVRGWKRKAGGKPLEHLDLLPKMIEFFEASQHFVRIQHIKAHQKRTDFPYSGNARADALAVESLELPQELM